MSDSPENPDTPPWAGDDEADNAKPSATELEAAGQNSMFGDPEPAPAPALTPATEPAPEPAPAPSVEQPSVPATPAPEEPAAAQPYRVLARKYRPQTFSELIGQEPMVRTLGNAIERDRLAHAFLMTGVRGVGKTSTARLIAKALNCIGPDGQGGPTINSCGVCEPCVAIAEGRHIDVIEMDAASHTGVDDVREIIEAVRYSAVSARYKIYIIDEVHMLSRNAFNALLKTLEEPPAHVKFLFATTEVDKLPVTVLSRTQRFDLRRIPRDMLQDHFASICRKEGVEAEDEALAMIANAAEGSVRDGLSILDQAIAHADLDAGEAGTTVRAAKVRDMLGLADKGAQRRLFQHLLEGNPQGLLAAVDQQYALGVEPLALIRALMEFTHRIAVTQVGGGEADASTAEEREALGEWAQKLSPGQVHRLWQLLIKGHDEVRTAPDPLVAAQMALLRVLHAADMPDPGKLAKQLKDAALVGGIASGGTGGGGSNAAPSGGAPQALNWLELVERVDKSHLHNAMSLSTKLRMQVRVIELAPGKLVFAQPDGFEENIVPEIKQALLELTGERWDIQRTEGEGAPTLVEQDEALRRAQKQRLESHPMMEAVRTHFPDAQLVEPVEQVRGRKDWSRTG
ncbi:DNA polymerase III subunit gamma/tau [Aurantiacibacter rhizosphaerae]|uniref:DNA polymerase III subunit gamma/tau n=1 Tax=Aurantiacibacter rhizosphaerae TaxID=2691582 RepID=A0A844XFH7_9SPHN|nr:DNA polymerase III subunit gamma/tau [Aurantiacibacter rhizosphaerae]MWV29371.1 DNA polymerase III subunit gamma/tau [Aurantiacibacter rhizosphaerae]